MTGLLVFVEGRLAGQVSRGAGASVVFRYDGAYLRDPRSTPLSLSAPLGRGTHEVGHWLDGLLPDNIAVRRRWASRSGASSARPMDLLGTPIGLDCAGAAQFCRPGDEEALHARASGLEPLSERQVADWIRRARQDWSAWEGPGSRGQFSLAGAQAKCAVHWDGRRWSAPYGNVPTTHILKPGVANHTDAEVVEHVCLAAARRLGLDAATSELMRFESERVVVVARFDRTRQGDAIRRRHQEDLCQALGLDPELKYQMLGGPAPQDIAGLLRRESTDSRADVERLRDALIYNWAIAAPDAHAKNYSVLLDGPDVRLAPLYDVISFLPYARSGPLDLHTAMSFGGDHSVGAMGTPDAWRTAGRLLGLDPEATADRAAELLRLVPAAIGDAIDGLAGEDRPSRALPPLRRAAQALADRILGRLSAAPAPGPAAGRDAQRCGPARTSSVLCGAGLSNGGVCRRRLLSRPCPLHPDSTGSRQISADQGPTRRPKQPIPADADTGSGPVADRTSGAIPDGQREP